MTDEELIARLREIQGQAGLFASEAADRIEALVKARREGATADRGDAHMTLARLIEAVEIDNEAAAKLEARKAYPDYAPDMGRAFNGSLDAAKRLHDALLPGWGWEINVLSARLENAQGDVAYGQRIDGPQSRLWLLAILRAMGGRDG